MLLLWSMAWAAECDATFTDADVLALVEEARSAVENDDVSGFKQTYRRFSKRVVCLDGPVPSAPWAELLVLDAIVRFAEGADARTPLATARGIDPDVEVPPFLAGVEPAPSGGAGADVPIGVKLYVDGSVVEEVAALQGDHVIQRDLGWKWESLMGNALPRGWMQPPGPAPKPTPDPSAGPDLWAIGAVGFGVRRVDQRPDEPGDYVAELASVMPGAVVSGELRVTVAEAGAFARVAAPLWLGRLSGGGLQPSIAGDAGVAYVLGTVQGEAGASVGLSPLVEGDEDRLRLDVLPTLGARWIDDGLDAGMSVGVWSDSQRLALRGGWSTPSGPGHFRLGLDLGASRRRFEQRLDDRTRSIAQSTLSARLTVGLVLD